MDDVRGLQLRCAKTFKHCLELMKLVSHIYRDELIDQEMISVRALDFDLVQLTCQRRFDCRKAIRRSSATFLGTS